MHGLTAHFSAHANAIGFGSDSGFSHAISGGKPITPQKTLLDTMGVKLPQITAGKVQDNVQVSINTSGSNVSAQVNQGQALTGAQQANNVQSVISNTIRDLQKTITQVTKDMGHDPKTIFPRAMGSVGDLAVDVAASAALPGVVGTASIVAEAVGHAKSKGSGSRQEIQAQIQQEIQSRSYAQSEPSTTQQVMDPGGAQNAEQNTPMQRLNAAFDGGFDVNYIMSLDPDNPVQLPEFRDAQNVGLASKDANLENVAVQNETEHKAGLTVAQEDSLAGTVDIDQAAGSSMNLEDVKLADLESSFMDDLRSTIVAMADLKTSQGLSADEAEINEDVMKRLKEASAANAVAPPQAVLQKSFGIFSA